MPTVHRDETSFTATFADLDELAQHAPFLAEHGDPTVRTIFRMFLDSLADNAESVWGLRGGVTIRSEWVEVGPDEDETWEVSWEVAD